jgi:hypothetical protein
MHATLRPRTNYVLLGVYVVVGALVVWFTPQPLLGLPAAVGAGVGLLCGVCQLKAIRERTTELLAAKSALEVRATLMSSTWGAAAIRLQWCGTVAVVAVAFAVFRPSVVELGAGVILGYLCLAALRDIVALPAVFRLCEKEAAM